MPVTNHKPTIGDWEAELNRARDRRLVSPSQESVTRCRRHLAELTPLIRQFSREARFDHHEFSVLKRLHHEILLRVRIARQELSHFELSDSPTVPTPLLERLINETRSRVQILRAQLQLIDSTLSLSEMLRPVIEGVLMSDGFPVSRFEPLLEKISVQKLKGQAESLIPWPGISLEQILAEAGWPQPWFYAQATHSARWVAAVRCGFAEDETYPCSFPIAAALLADIGLVMISRKRPGLLNGKDARGVAAYRQHPNISAAVISGISGASLEWGLLAGQHHERLDGSGFPEKLSGRALTPACRGFTAATRWSELLLQDSAASTPEETLAITAMALWKETQKGQFDAACVQRMFAAVDSQLLVTAQQSDVTEPVPLLDPAHGLTGPHHSVEVDTESELAAPGPPSPQYLRHVHRHPPVRSAWHYARARAESPETTASGKGRD